MTSFAHPRPENYYFKTLSRLLARRLHFEQQRRFLLTHPHRFFSFFAGLAQTAQLVAALGQFRTKRLQHFGKRRAFAHRFLHHDAIDRARREAKLAAGTFGGDDRMHLLGGADDCIDRTGRQAFRAADTVFFDNYRDNSGFMLPASRVERPWRDAQKIRQRQNAFLPAGRATVYVGRARRNGLGIWPASVIAAFSALGLRQQEIDLIDHLLLNLSLQKVNYTPEPPGECLARLYIIGKEF
jgi:hypothetical protein